MTGAVAIILAAGSGERLGNGEPKAFLQIGGRPLVALAVEAAAACPAVTSIVVTVPEGRVDSARSALDASKPVAVVPGGPTRQASVRAGLAAVPADAPAVLCHDAARPFASPDLFSVVLGGLVDAEGSIPVIPVGDTVKRVRDGLVLGTEARGDLWLAQTPQAFATSALRDAHARAEKARIEFTDDAAVLEWAGYRVRTVPGDPGNFKITTAADLKRAERVVAETHRA